MRTGVMARGSGNVFLDLGFNKDEAEKTDDPFRTFHEWDSAADTKAYGKL